MTHYVVKRVYAEPEPSDGLRVLVDRLWPRGVSKERADAVWLKDVAPSPELRKEWHHDEGHFEEFAERYRAELAQNPAVAELASMAAGHETATLVFAAHDPEVNHAVVLAAWMNEGHGA